MPHRAYVRWFWEFGADSKQQVGGKNAGLGEMIRAGLRVPTGFAVTTRGYERFLEDGGIREEMRHILDGIRPEDTAELGRASERIRHVVETTPLPSDVEAAVVDAYAKLADECQMPDPPVAVRSSATAEDSAEASFAGQQDTYLWVHGPQEVVAHARRCWSSLYTPQAIAYRARLGAEHGTELMSVGVQRMVDARVAGVMFTLNPLNGDRSKVVINASWGLGLSVVGGEVTPDEYWVDKVTLDVIKRTLSPKELQYLQAPSGDGVVAEAVPAEKQCELCLSDDEVRELARLGKLIEQHNGAPQDIEWAIDRRLPFPESVLLLQSRPETVWSRRPAVPISTRTGSGLDYVTDFLLIGQHALAGRLH